MLSIGRNFLERHWPVLLSGLMLPAGLFVVLSGVTGLTSAATAASPLHRHFRQLLRP